MAMPKAATKPMQRALIAQPTAIVRPAPLTAESICPAMMDAMIPPRYNSTVSITKSRGNFELSKMSRE